MNDERTDIDTDLQDPLNLKSLPPQDAPAGLWNEIEQRLDARAAQPETKRAWVPMAMAATVAAMALTISLLRPDAVPQPDADPGASLVRLQAVSASLETQLETYRNGVVSATTVDAIARMEQELAWLDAQLSETPTDVALWAERVALLGEMNQRYLRADWRTELMLASY